MNAPLSASASSASTRFTRLHWALLACLLAGTLATRLVRLGTPDNQYWDEQYFGFTAQRYLAGDANAYNPYATPPPDKAYEWTHPPLGKLIIAGTMALAGQDAWGMRLSSVLFGTAGVGLVVLIAFLLTRSPSAGLLAGLLYAADGLNFVQSRVATMDIHQTTFILASVAFYIAWRREEKASHWLLLGAGAMAGAALATKWVGLFLITLLGADLLVLWIILRRQHGLATILVAGACMAILPASVFAGRYAAERFIWPEAAELGCLIAIMDAELLVLWVAFRRPRGLAFALTAIACLLLLPAAIYMASYAHYFRMGYGWHNFVELQRQMWYYHTGLKATHPNTSKPWQWILNLRPMWMYVKYGPPDRIANIYNLGNSVVLCFGLIAMAWTAIRSAWRRWEAGFLVAAYLIFWLPWVHSPRIMFFYHYLPSSAFLCVASGWLLWTWQGSRWRALRVLVWVVPGLALAWFVVFYPDWTAITVPRWWADSVYAFIPSWK
jgi:dolichyl-phosphate-mannose-protein mannosyltransferase